ncbi:Ca2+-dependent phosphoinositide-specific phospholipase C [Sporomusa malonica]|uniref:Phosphoinositide phospholipase C, Ca2+-dependent n=1 Tax=Sporomusa malonica TaxID=112901 RepID=A0A1W2F2W0_9FIRM|nr:Ca2+-dependent phosphoinositide-specific phospholipase C [Sporomusa malonica]SMD16283.1 Phosphoinositide phospholipase C, Ca2+-dependent [Sporomusa malonica]
MPNYTSYDVIRYNQVFQKQSHNSYTRSEGVFDQVLYWKIRSLEFDVHPDQNETDVGSWTIYHAGVPFGSSQAHVTNLNGVMEIYRGINNALPNHEVITIFLEIVEDISALTDAQANDFDTFIRTNLGDIVYTPADLLQMNGSPATLQAAVTQGNWPLLQEMRGKFVFVLNRCGRSQYCGTNGQLANGRACFFADQVSTAENVGRFNYIAFYSIAWADRAIGPTVNQHYVGRVYPEFNYSLTSPGYSLSTQEDWSEAKNSRIQIIATNKVDSIKDPWASTNNMAGFPFEGIDVQIDPQLGERGALLGHGVNSGDIWDKKDSFFFQYRTASAQAGSYVYYIGCPYYNANTWAKCGIMVRATTDADSPYFGIFRSVGELIRVQYRTKKGNSTYAVEVSSSSLVPDGVIRATDCVCVKLEIAADRKQATAWASLEGGDSWIQIDQRSFSDALVLEGIASASHGDQDVRFIIGDPQNSGSLSAFDQSTLIGEGVNMGMSFPFYPPARQIAAVVSLPTPEEGQDQRSSGNFNTQEVPERTIMVNWRVEQNDAWPLSFDVMRDDSSNPDNTIFYKLAAGLRTDVNVERSLYIADPVCSNSSNFLVVADAIGYFAESPVKAIPGFSLVASVMSRYQKQDGQENRSSGNFSIQNLPANTVAYAWTISENSDYAKIKFNVLKDVSGTDKNIFSDVTHLQVTTTYTDRNLYIANPDSIDNQEPFLVSVYAIDHLPPNAPLVGQVSSHYEPKHDQHHRSSDNFSTNDVNEDSIKLYWEIDKTTNSHADEIEFDVMEDKNNKIDPTIFSNLRSGSWTKVKRSSKLYIANPNNAGNEDFTVKVYELPKTFPM